MPRNGRPAFAIPLGIPRRKAHEGWKKRAGRCVNQLIYRYRVGARGHRIEELDRGNPRIAREPATFWLVPKRGRNLASAGILVLREHEPWLFVSRIRNDRNPSSNDAASVPRLVASHSWF